MRVLANKLSGKYSQWGSVLIQANQKRVIPVHSHQSITRLNTSWTNEIEEVNQHRARQQNLTKDDINLLKNQISKNLEHQDRAESDYIKAEVVYTNFNQMKRAQATPPEILNAQSDQAIAESYRDQQLQRYRIKYNDLQSQLKNWKINLFQLEC